MPKKKRPSILKEIKSFIPKETNYAGGEKTISYSQYSVYKTCPLKWNLTYKEKLFPFNNNINTIFGTAIHEALQKDLSLFYEVNSIAANEFDTENMFKEKFISLYKENYIENKNTHFSTPEELREFFEDGIKIIQYFKKNRNKYFGKRGWYLIGCEIPILLNPDPKFKKIKFKGYIDVVLYNEKIDQFYIMDIKTSNWGWNDLKKKDELKQNQLLLYKEFFSQQFNIPIEKVNIEFFIVKRKLYENTDFVIKRIQSYIPISGKTKMKKALVSFNSFINECFDVDGKYKEIKHQPKPGKHCEWCPFNDKPSLCSKIHSS